MAGNDTKLSSYSGNAIKPVFLVAKCQVHLKVEHVNVLKNKIIAAQ